ncbi:L-serine ammonia-lyase, iron-sulfur-dependent, subunit alpha [Ihubacter massiliensis]|uniref:L-serine ammonia-lyase n=1 Tax=Hominibacterium faecale TaxID=2839743 RepID=A0A9J6QRK7_9FIRM|nr:MULTISPECIES: L-serine ammonia-lyase, iron-sulfur-dependent, subunit alpha [Eubacteriales Family XIII. Incertae Sedis]MCO7121561.1 L-serine ammonia-lyase, iron-sulfur-dependent, subunit alpha [Ihubacter massiliensis]MCU7378541.1 L-serine ammonia-lyase, iron-sulfur-dependent, subunit alpha [Hominibacterium faecale]
MSRYYASIFNDVLGPVMTGPSSSATAGPGRVGRMAGMLMEDVKEIEIRFARDGGFGESYRGSMTDIAIVAGILGMDLTHKDFLKSYEKAEAAGISVSIVVEDVEVIHPDLIKISMTGRDGEKVKMEGVSLGGAIIEIISINDIAVSLKGSTTEIIVMADEKPECIDTITEILRNREIPFDVITEPEDALAEIRVYAILDAKVKNEIQEKIKDYGDRVRILDPVMPVVDKPDVKVSYSTAAELQAYLKTHDIPLWEAAVLYEQERTGWSREEVLNFAEMLLDRMGGSVAYGIKSDFQLSGFLTPKAAQLKKAYEEGKWFDTGIIAEACIYAVAVMECNAALGILVAGPTAGSCGVLPGILFSAYNKGNYDKQDLVKALMCAGLIGVFIAEQATFAAEVAGCQAENGSASAMAAAAGVHLLGGTADQALNAASLAFQHLLGLVCDALGECAEIPCISRNAATVSNAIISAQLAVGGFDGVVPLDETIQAMMNCGELMARELRATMLGGLCITPTGQRIEKEMQKKFYVGDECDVCKSCKSEKGKKGNE